MKIVAANKGWGPIVTLQGSYHGRSPFSATLSASPRYRKPIQVQSTEVLRLPFPERCDHGVEEEAQNAWEDACITFLERSLGERGGIDPGELSAFVLEPVLNVSGMAVPSTGFLQSAVAMCREAGALIVVDEVFTGFHRVGPRYGFQLHDIEPDIVVLSKALTNGVAGFSAVWAREPLLAEERFPPGTHSSTMAGAPITLAVAEEVIDRLSDWTAWRERSDAICDQMKDIVEEAVQRFPDVVASGYATGAVARIKLRENIAWRVRQAALLPGSEARPGLLLASTGMASDVVSLHPPLTICQEDLAVVRDGVADALRHVSRDR
jgi:4-aminobutyrate aminotransferase-like enzyme